MTAKVDVVFSGTAVMKVTAYDADEPWSSNSEIAYSIVEQVPPEDMFNISKHGDIYVKRPLLDREVWTAIITTFIYITFRM